jgi:hypothetical protein
MRKKIFKLTLCISLAISCYAGTQKGKSPEPTLKSSKTQISAPNTVTSYYGRYNSSYSVITVDNGYTIPEITVTGTTTVNYTNVVLTSNASLNTVDEIVFSNSNKTWFVPSDPLMPPFIVNGVSNPGVVKLTCFCNQGSGTCQLRGNGLEIRCDSEVCAGCGMNVIVSGIYSYTMGGVLIEANSIKVNNVIY